MSSAQHAYASDLSPEILEKAKAVEVVDKDGKAHTFGDLTSGRRTCLIFIRHFWCINCRTYVEHIGQCIPPENLPDGISSCGSSAPIPIYLEESRSPYPVYGNPNLELYKLFGWKSNLAQKDKNETTKDYMSGLGVWSGPLKAVGSALQRVHHVNAVGPKTQNGGEMILEADGTCSLLHRMENTADHLDVRELAERIGAKYTPMPPRRGSAAAAGKQGSCDGDGQACDARS